MMVINPRTTEQHGSSRSKSRKVSKPIWIALAALAVVGTLATASTSAGFVKAPRQEAVTPKKRAVPVATVTTNVAALMPIPDTLSVTGTISAIDPLSIGSSSQGLVITQVNVEEGDYVKKGQVLCALDSSVMRAQLAGAQARLSSAHASVAKAEQPNRQEDIMSFEAAYQQSLADIHNRQALLDQANASKNLAQSNANRYEVLLKEGAISQMDAQTKQTDLLTATSAVHAAEDNLKVARFMSRQAANRLAMAREGGRKEDVDISQAAAQVDAASVQQMQAQIAQTIVRAPDDGLITRRFAHIGDVASSAKPLFEMIRKGEIELRAKVSQDDIARLSVGQSSVVMDKTRKTEGKVFQVSPVVDETTRLGTVRIAVPASSGFKPGMFVKGLVDRGRRTALTVPNSAVLADEGINYVYVYKSGIASKQIVTVGSRIKNVAEITSGIEPGALVIVAGAGFLNDQDAVALAQ